MTSVFPSFSIQSPDRVQPVLPQHIGAQPDGSALAHIGFLVPAWPDRTSTSEPNC
jgi:hypothetical protein